MQTVSQNLLSLFYAAVADLWTGSDTAKVVHSKVLVDAAAPQALTDGATISWNMASGYNAAVTLGGNRTLAAPTNYKEGVTYVLKVKQDGTGSRTLAWNSCYDFGSAGTPTLSTTAAKEDLVFLYCYDATTPKFRASFNKAS